MEGRFLDAPTVDALRAALDRAVADGMDAVFLASGPLGDAVALASSLTTGSPPPPILLGVRTNLSAAPHRHPTVLARDMTAFDLLSKGQSVLAFAPPLGDEVSEAIALCRAMWRDGVATSDGPHYPVAGAINRPRPYRDGGPPVALDLTDGIPVDPALMATADLLLVRDEAGDYPDGVARCRIAQPPMAT